MHTQRTGSILAILVVAIVTSGIPTAAGTPTFVDVTDAAGVTSSHGFPGGPANDNERQAGAAAAGDIDGDGWLDLYVSGGGSEPNRLFRNLGNGTFEEIGASAGVASGPAWGSGAVFADVDGDGWLDLLAGAIVDRAFGRLPAIYRNTGGGTFTDVTGSSGMAGSVSYSMSLADIDRDGDLDAMQTSWADGEGMALWRNDGTFQFTEVTALHGLMGHFVLGFTPNFSDVTGDGWVDLLVTGDFGTSAIFTNDQDGTFTRDFSAPLTDENGMGGSVGDYDNDGLLDWFVTSIWDPDGNDPVWGSSGNRLYRNVGDGSWEDKTDEAGVRIGWWGWGSCFADFDNDGWLDIFHVNGYSVPLASDFFTDPSRLFMSNGDGTFTERSVELGIDDTEQGRGIVCFDYDRDGDVDIFIANNEADHRLYRNDGGNTDHFLSVELAGSVPNTEAIGAKVRVTVGGTTQLREVHAGSNFSSSDPAVVHFGLGSATTVDELRVDWPLGGSTVMTAVPADQFLTVTSSPSPPPPVPDGSLPGSVPMRVARLDASGQDLSISWDTASCGGASDYRIVHGTGSQFPSAQGRPLGIEGAACDVGTTSPVTWSSPDAAADPSNLVWWLLVADDNGITEGSWGTSSDGRQRRGPGPRGSSGLCSAICRDLNPTCE